MGYKRNWLQRLFYRVRRVTIWQVLLFLPVTVFRLVRWAAQKLWRMSIFDVVAMPVRAVVWGAKRPLRISYIVMVAAGLVVGVVGFRFIGVAKPIVRDAVIVVVADRLAGPDQPLTMCDFLFAEGREDCDLVYSRNVPLPQAIYWGLVTNSPYMIDRSINIVGLFAADHITQEPLLVQQIFFMPLIGEGSTHLGGQTDCQNYVMANERYVTFDGWNDARDIQTTLTHELVHVQRGNFCGTPVPLPDNCEVIVKNGARYYGCEGEKATDEMRGWIQRRSVWVESHTSAATVEALAAQCNVGERVSCKAFWQNVSGLARGSLNSQLRQANLGFLYKPFMDLFVYDRAESRRADRSYRDYALDGPRGIAARNAIITKYYYMPWVTYVVPGIVHDALLDTGNIGFQSAGGEAKYYSVILGMPYDDTQIMFGPVGTTFLRLMTQWTPVQDVDTGGLPVPEFVTIDGMKLLPMNWQPNISN